MQTEDEHIIHKCLNGEPEAFGFLVDKYKESVYAFAYTKLRNFHDAEDITQEVFIKAYQKLNTLKRWDSFLAWIYAITSNMCKNLMRDRSKKPDHEFIEDKNPKLWEYNSINSYYENMSMQSVDDLIDEALDSLPEIYSHVIVLYYLGNMNSFEIARFLGVSPTIIRERLSRARLLLRREMLAMMGKTFEEERLKAGFTFRIVEMLKNVKVQPFTPNALPWGLSVSISIIALVLGIGPHLNMPDDEILTSIPSAIGGSRVLNVGEFPVDIMKVSDISVMTNANSNGNGSSDNEPGLQNALSMVPQVEDGTWTKKADMPTARQQLSVCTVNGKIYAIGGCAWDNIANVWRFFSTVEEYDPNTNTWTKKADMSKARHELSTSVVNGRIYAIGGSTDGDDDLSIVEEYDPANDKWTKKADMPTPRKSVVTCAVNERIYAIMGGGAGWPGLSTVEEYDPANDKWIKKKDAPVNRSTTSAAVVNGKIYIIGGSHPEAVMSETYEYDPESDKWTRKANMITARYGLASVAVDEKIYAFGGWNGKDYVKIVEEYDVVKDRWTEMPDMPIIRSYHAATPVNGKIYVIGGAGPISRVDEFDTGFESKSINFKGKLPTTWGNMRIASNR